MSSQPSLPNRKKTATFTCSRRDGYPSFGMLYHFEDYEEEHTLMGKYLANIIAAHERVPVDRIKSIVLYQEIDGRRFYLSNCDFIEDINLFCEYELDPSS